MKKTRYIMALVAAMFAVGAMLFVACEKDGDLAVQLNDSAISKGVNGEIPYFDDYQQLRSVLNAAIDCKSIAELIKYEKSQGRQSIGAQSDLFYEQVDQSGFSSLPEVLDFYSRNMSVLDTAQDKSELTISPKFFNNPYRYVANADGLFVVGQIVYRIFKSGTVSVKMAFKNELISLSEDDLMSIDTTVFHFEPINTSSPSTGTTLDHNNCSDEYYFENVKQSGNDRVVIELTTITPGYWGLGCMAAPKIHVYSRHKCVGVWWVCKHTLTCQGDFTYHYKDVSNNWASDTFTINETKSSIGWWIHCAEIPLYNSKLDSEYFHYASIHLKARTPSLGYAQIFLN